MTNLVYEEAFIEGIDVTYVINNFQGSYFLIEDLKENINNIQDYGKFSACL